MKQRVRMFFDAWYQPEVRMSKEEWIYIGSTLLACSIAFWVGFGFGTIWVKL